jgi:dihydrofolate synthase/folylpolyglutamate synthase
MVDKPLRDMIESVSKLSSVWHLPNNQAGDRAALPADLAQLVRAVDHSATVTLYDTPSLAYEGVHEVTGPGDRIIVFGSFVTVGEQMKLLQRHA